MRAIDIAIGVLFIAFFVGCVAMCTGSEPCERGHGLYTGRAC